MSRNAVVKSFYDSIYSVVQYCFKKRANDLKRDNARIPYTKVGTALMASDAIVEVVLNVSDWS